MDMTKKIQKLLFVILTLSFLNRGNTQDEAVISGDSTNLNIQNPSTNFRPYLECLNRLPSPTRLEDVNSDNPGSPSENPNLFNYNFGGTNGMFFLTTEHGYFVSNVRTSPQSQGRTAYHLLYTAPSKRVQLLSGDFTAEGGPGRVFSQWYEQDKIQEQLPSLNPTILGESDQKISRAQALSIIEPAGERFIQELPEYYKHGIESFKIYAETKRLPQDVIKKYTEGKQRQVQEALCSCMKTQNPRLVNASRAVASQLSFIKNPDECQTALVSSFKVGVWTYLFTLAYAKAKQDTIAQIDLGWTPLVLYKENNQVRVCGKQKSATIILKNFEVIEQEANCSKKILNVGSNVITDSKTKALIKDNKVIFTKL
jgi:hypothetical protein